MSLLGVIVGVVSVGISGVVGGALLFVAAARAGVVVGSCIVGRSCTCAYTSGSASLSNSHGQVISQSSVTFARHDCRTILSRNGTMNMFLLSLGEKTCMSPHITQIVIKRIHSLHLWQNVHWPGAVGGCVRSIQSALCRPRDGCLASVRMMLIT